MNEPSRSALRHALATPLNQIIGYSEMLAEEAEELGQQSFVADLHRIETAGRRLLALIDEHLRAPAPRDAVISGECRPASIEDASDAAPAPREPTPLVQAASLLVVDDNELNRDMLSRRLEQRGYEVTCASDGTEAIRLIDGRSFDLVLLDVMMPGLSGLDVLDAVRPRRSLADLPIVMATAQNASTDIVEALRRGANDYVTKPLDLPVVVARVESLLAVKRARDEIKQLNRELEEAQARIAALTESSSRAVDDLTTWSAAVAGELARSLAVRRVETWLFDSEPPAHPVEVTAADIRAAAASSRPLARPGATYFPVLGMTGEVFGAVVVRTEGQLLREASQRLVAAFARQLGGALELKRARDELARATERQRVTAQALLDRGIDLLRICPACGRCYDQRPEQCDHDHSILRPPEAFPYRVSGRYRMVRFVGEGGMGTVFRATDERLGRDVALKVLRAEYFNNAAVRGRFEKEARAIARIDHPGVIAVFDSGENEDGSLFMVMEWLDGIDLGRLLEARGPGTPQEVAALVRQGAAALAAAHRAALVHRDIKPENIFLLPTAEGSFRIKILDFGVAKEISSDSRFTQSGVIVGTPMFMSPEQLRGEAVDGRSDIYSFAAVAYEALTGRRVSPADDYVKILIALVDDRPAAAVSSLLPGAPVEVDRGFARGLARRPADRPSSAEEWAGSFTDALEQTASPAAGWARTLRELHAGVEIARRRSAPTQDRLDTASDLIQVTRAEVPHALGAARRSKRS